MLHKIVLPATVRLHIGDKLPHDIELVEARKNKPLLLCLVVDELL